MGVGVLAEHKVADQPQVRLQDHQGLSWQTGVEPLTQRRESMIGSRQDIAVEDQRPVARKNRLVSTWQFFQNRSQFLGAEADDGFAEFGIDASEFGIECLVGGRDRWCRRGLVGGIGSEHRRPLASGNLDEQADKSINGQLEGILLGSMLLEKLFQSLRIEERFHDATDHDAEGHRRAMRKDFNRNHLEVWPSEKFLNSVESLGATSVSPGIGAAASGGASAFWLTHPCLQVAERRNPLPPLMITQPVAC